MQSVDAIEALAGIGLNGDMHALAESTRQVLLVEKETLDGLNLEPGIIKENITTERIGLMKLESGSRLQIGGAVLQITRACKPCYRLEEIRKGLLTEIDGRRGMLARVLEGGIIRVEDTITLL